MSRGTFNAPQDNRLADRNGLRRMCAELHGTELGCLQQSVFVVVGQ